jgi:hypothetical protein
MKSPRAEHELTEFERIARSLVHPLGLSSATTWEALVAQIELVYGKSIRFRPVADEDWGAVTGLFLDTPSEGLIYFREAHSFLFQLHNVYHEFGHILLRDRSCGLVEGLSKQDVFTLGIREEFQEAYANGVEFDDPDLIANEREAEEVAYLIAKLLRTRPVTLRTEVFG